MTAPRPAAERILDDGRATGRCGVALLFLVRGERMLRPLGVARDWLEKNNTTLMAVVITVIGVALLLKGFGDL